MLPAAILAREDGSPLVLGRNGGLRYVTAPNGMHYTTCGVGEIVHQDNRSICGLFFAGSARGHLGAVDEYLACAAATTTAAISAGVFADAEQIDDPAVYWTMRVFSQVKSNRSWVRREPLSAGEWFLHFPAFATSLHVLTELIADGDDGLISLADMAKLCINLTLKRIRNKGGFPPAAHVGSGRAASQYNYRELRGWLIAEFPRQQESVPESFAEASRLLQAVQLGQQSP
jgi:hypothetical protein